MSPTDEDWLRAWTQAQGHALDGDVRWRETASGAWLAFGEHVVAKIHPPRTDPQALAQRLAAADSPALSRWVVAPLTTAVGSHPGARLVTLWPRRDVLDPERDPDVDQDLPWAHLGSQLAGLHRASSPAKLPRHGAIARVRRALERLDRERLDPGSGLVRTLGERLVGEAEEARGRHTGLVHGDWHLGQLARMPDGWRLLDVDDLGVGDPAWDLGRPAGFWAAGLVPSEAWNAFVAGYRAAAGPAILTTGDPWPDVDLPARCAVFIAACRELSHEQQGHSSLTVDALLAACERM